MSRSALLARLREEPDASTRPTGTGRPSSRHVAPSRAEHEYALAMRILHEGAVPLAEAIPGMSTRERLRIAVIVPPFRFGSGGHDALFQVVSRLEERGHVCTLWVDDPFRELAGQAPSALRRSIVESFAAPVRAPVYTGFEHWHGADVVCATGWQTVYRAMGLPGCRARAYWVNDYEPEFYGTSIETHLSAMTYRQGLHCIGGSPWLLDLLRERYGAEGGVFRYGIDPDYRERPVERRRDTVVLYARTVTPRRAVALGVLALEELWRRRADRVRIIMFGDEHPLPASFPYEFLGIVSPNELSWIYSEATAGLAFSMTNTSLVPQDMMACGLPAIELEGFGGESVYGTEGPIELAPYDPAAIADRLERLLDDREEWERRHRSGLALARTLTWDAASQQIERELRAALRAREPSVSST